MTRGLGIASAICSAALALGAVAQTGGLGAWSSGAQLPVPRSEDAVAAVGSTIYVIGGYAPAGAHPAALDSTGAVDVDEPLVQAFDLNTGRWSDRAPLPRGLNH